LLRFSREALDVFLKIECPEAPGAPPESDAYETIGQFYDAIRGGLRALCAELGEPRVFCGDPARQISDAPFPGGGRIIASTVSPRRSRRSTKSWNKVRALRMSRCDFPSFRRRVCHKSVRRSVIAGTRTTTLNRITTEGT